MKIESITPADRDVWLDMRGRLWPDARASDVDRFYSGESREPLAVLIAKDDAGRARGQGIGRALVAACEEWARSQGCSEFASDAEPDNETSIAAHLALGFSDEGLVRCFRKDL